MASEPAREPPSSWALRHAEPFGPLDSIVLVDSEAELLAAMNASNGCLVASIATDDPAFGARAAEQLQAFKVGINKPRSRGDRDEVFGGSSVTTSCHWPRARSSIFQRARTLRLPRPV